MTSALILKILSDGKRPTSTYYRLSRIPMDPGSKGWRLTKPDGAFYDVILRGDGEWQCDCANFINKRERHHDVCKHISSTMDLIAKGLFG